MTRLYCVCAALLIALLLAASAAGPGASTAAQESSPVASPEGTASGCGASAATPVAVVTPPSSAAGEPELLMSPERLMWAGGPHAVVLLHQINLDMRSWTPQAEALAAAGYAVVAIENAGPNGLGIAIADLRGRCGIETVTVIGASIGGNVAGDALRSDPAAFDRIVILSSDVDTSLFGDMPKLFVASEGEGMSYDPAALATASAGDDNTSITYPGTAHAQEIFQTENGPDLLGQILAWLAAHP